MSVLTSLLLFVKWLYSTLYFFNILVLMLMLNSTGPYWHNGHDSPPLTVCLFSFFFIYFILFYFICFLYFYVVVTHCFLPSPFAFTGRCHCSIQSPCPAQANASSLPSPRHQPRDWKLMFLRTTPSLPPSLPPSLLPPPIPSSPFLFYFILFSFFLFIDHAG